MASGRGLEERAQCCQPMRRNNDANGALLRTLLFIEIFCCHEVAHWIVFICYLSCLARFHNFLSTTERKNITANVYKRKHEINLITMQTFSARIAKKIVTYVDINYRLDFVIALNCEKGTVVVKYQTYNLHLNPISTVKIKFQSRFFSFLKKVSIILVIHFLCQLQK